MALIARYHRRATPKKGHPGYSDLPSALRRVVKINAACVRLAEGLDRSHAQVLASVRLYDRGRDAVLQLNTTGDAELELWAAGRHVDAFEDLIGKPVRFEVAAARQRRTAAPATNP